MSRRILSYCISIWLTSVVLGPVIYFIWNPPQNSDLIDLGGYWLLAALGGLILSIPCLLLLWAGARFIVKRSLAQPPGRPRLLIAGWAFLLTIIPFLVLFGKDDPNTGSDTIAMWICYLVPILGGIVLYKPPLQPDEDLSAVQQPGRNKIDTDKQQGI